VPRGIVNIPEPPKLHGTEKAGGAVLDQSLTAIPEGLQQAGHLVVEAQALEAHRQKAFETLNATTQHQEFRPDLATAVDQLRQGGDWQQMPERVLEEGNRLIGERGAKLGTPYARALFEQHAKETLAVSYQHALDERTKRTEQVTTFTFAKELQHAQEAYAGATNDYDRMVAQGQLEDIGKRFVDSGLVDGAKVAVALKQTYDGMQAERVKAAIQVDPAGMRTQLLAQIRGGETRADLPLAPPDKVAELAHEAWQTQHQQLGEKEHAEHLADYHLGKQQEQAAADIRARLTVLQPIPESVPGYDALLKEVNQKAQGATPTISGQAQQEFTNHIRTLRAAALHPREVDDGPTERKLTILIDAADNDQDLQHARGVVIQNAGLLKPATFKTLLNSVYERQKADHYSLLPGYREGVRVIMGGDIAEGNYMAMLRGSMQETEQVRLRTTLDLYRSRMAEIATQSRAQANAEGPDIAIQLRREQMDVPAKEEKLKRLPLPLQGPDGKTGVIDEEQAKTIIQKMSNVTSADRQRIFEQWQQWHKSAAPVTPSATPQPSTRQKVSQ